LPTAIYGVVLLCAGIAYYIMQTTIVRAQGPQSMLGAAIGRDWKGKLSPLLYAAAIPLAFVHQLIADAIYVTVALIWLVPDRRIESRVGAETVEAKTAKEAKDAKDAETEKTRRGG